MKMLKARLYEVELKKREAAADKDAEREAVSNKAAVLVAVVNKAAEHEAVPAAFVSPV